MACSACGGPVERDDSYCRGCGRPAQGRLLPVPVMRHLPVARPLAVPRVVVGGMMVLLLGKVARWALRQAFDGMTQKMGQARAVARSNRVLPAPQGGGVTLPPGSRVVTRVWWHTELYVPPAPAVQPKPRRRLFGR